MGSNGEETIAENGMNNERRELDSGVSSPIQTGKNVDLLDKKVTGFLHRAT